jgi:hypothetical protein
MAGRQRRVFVRRQVVGEGSVDEDVDGDHVYVDLGDDVSMMLDSTKILM